MALNITSREYLWLCVSELLDALLNCICVCLWGFVVPSIVIWSPSRESLPLAELVSSFLLAADVCTAVKIQDQKEKGSRGDGMAVIPGESIFNSFFFPPQDYTETEHVWSYRSQKLTTKLVRDNAKLLRCAGTLGSDRLGCNLFPAPDTQPKGCWASHLTIHLPQFLPF